MAPVFVLGAPWRIGPEILAARRTARERLDFVLAQAVRVVRAPIRPVFMGERLRQMAAVKAADWCPRIVAPTLVVTGEPQLDRVVPVEGTRRFGTAIRGATVRMMPGTGHLGSVTQPDVFADAVWEFVSGLAEASPHVEGP
jgi:pimeloyl-ACP methyl ester carboxylesterase